jgi:hypothetical protein
MITFSFFAILAWIGWSALVFGWPEKLARQASRLEPGFVGHFNLFGVSFAVLGNTDLVLADRHQSTLADARHHALDGRSDPLLATDCDALDALDRLRENLPSGIGIAGQGAAREA